MDAGPTRSMLVSRRPLEVVGQGLGRVLGVCLGCKLGLGAVMVSSILAEGGVLDLILVGEGLYLLLRCLYLLKDV